MQERIKNQLKVNEVDYEKQTLDMLYQLAEDPSLSMTTGRDTEDEGEPTAKRAKHSRPKLGLWSQQSLRELDLSPRIAWNLKFVAT